jgi:hypothetical protein
MIPGVSAGTFFPYTQPYRYGKLGRAGNFFRVYSGYLKIALVALNASGVKYYYTILNPGFLKKHCDGAIM